MKNMRGDLSSTGNSTSMSDSFARVRDTDRGSVPWKNLARLASAVFCYERILRRKMFHLAKKFRQLGWVARQLHPGLSAWLDLYATAPRRRLKDFSQSGENVGVILTHPTDKSRTSLHVALAIVKIQFVNKEHNGSWSALVDARGPKMKF